MICKGQSVTLNGNNGTGMNYAWSPATTLTNSNTINPVASPATTQTYNVLITDLVCNFSKSFPVLVTVNPLPNVKAEKVNDISCGQSTTLLSASGASSYLWEPAILLNNSAIASPLASPRTTTLFMVTGTDSRGCKNKDSVQVKVESISFGYFVPNSFTPNNDGVNDCFNVRNFGINKNFRFMIFDRWGTKVFETNNVNACWNGTIAGIPANAGSYVFYINGENNCGTIVKKGSILLIR